MSKINLKPWHLLKKKIFQTPQEKIHFLWIYFVFRGALILAYRYTSPWPKLHQKTVKVHGMEAGDSNYLTRNGIECPKPNPRPPLFFIIIVFNSCIWSFGRRRRTWHFINFFYIRNNCRIMKTWINGKLTYFHFVIRSQVDIKKNIRKKNTLSIGDINEERQR